jgi:simple sugar transport system ATP-binding protein
VETAARALSGGNQQKLLMGRELADDPRVLVVSQPTRGVDIAASRAIHRRLLAARDAGRAVLLNSLDLDEIKLLSDRILVMFDGRIVGELARGEATDEALGLLMAGQEASS